MAAIVEFLETLGVDPADVPDNPGDAAALASDTVLCRGEAFSLRTLAEAAATDVDEAGATLRHLGIRIDDPDTVMFTERDVEMLRFLQSSLSLFTPDEGNELLHVVATTLSSVAEASVSAHVQGPESRVASFVDNARLNVEISERGLQLGHQLATGFRHHLRQAAQRQRRRQSETHRELQELTIGFVDLVGFTSLSQTLDPDRIVSLVSTFETRAHELAHELHVRVVKLIGDEVMFVAEQPLEAARFALGMVDAFSTDDVVPRGGLAAGSLVTVHGDYFGPVVNLAARLVDTAVPGEILVDDTVAADVPTEPAGRRMLKGLDQPVTVHSLVATAD